jgi:hypothetical protein
MNLVVKLTADATAAERGVAAFSKKAGSYVGSIGSELKSQLVGAFAAGAVISAVRSFGAHVVETVDNIKDMSEQLGVSTDEIQRMQKAANDAGIKFTVISGALQRIEALRSQAASGDAAAGGLFAGLGIDPTQGNALSILTQAVEASARGARENALLFDMVGRKASVLKGVVSEIKAQGQIDLISENSIAKIDQANARLEESKRRLTALATPAMTAGIEATTGTIEDLLGGNRGLNMGGFIRALASLTSGNKLPPMAADTFVGPEQGGIQSSSIAASTPAASAISLGQPGDSLSRIGLFVGGRPEVRSLASIERNTAESARQVAQSVRTLKSIEELLKVAGGEL